MSTLWTLVEKKKITKTITQFEFSSSSYLVRNFVKGVEWFGRHFTVIIKKFTKLIDLNRFMGLTHLIKKSDFIQQSSALQMPIFHYAK